MICSQVFVLVEGQWQGLGLFECMGVDDVKNGVGVNDTWFFF